MIVDTSALVAILRDEPEAAACARAIERSRVRRMSAANFLEAAPVIDGSRDARAITERLCAAAPTLMVRPSGSCGGSLLVGIVNFGSPMPPLRRAFSFDGDGRIGRARNQAPSRFSFLAARKPPAVDSRSHMCAPCFVLP